ncbi:MAG: ribonuclease III, ribonuclease III [candidate division WS6 bacterium GW2011_GWC1_33_20]|uniref:Ribonuclease 3 n=2 Tax=Candidatus Dojkabacteria TaxID=74243 RepID=A0A0G0AVR6_9BACT|nr:MAG: ribonuclease III, ribonuclease III [candidate division WS6 bacterium GW2011_GWC1_33_20]KKP46037.1 MAG: ribonuclease III, ribonuclease III [candidate division WS6 bacterium GW2011_GWF1_33_233]KKP55451.1 MAG: Ribonuclease 3 [candidate division WS6 bacterium GW2011_GWB1_33_6]KKP82341.1 MAG: Ribonuclease 3 [candidate division WS6 bacterium GW2011_GWD1_35_594]HBB64372.1 ribonuclease III [Patescibacteria group bacterium]
MNNLETFEKNISLEFKNKELLLLALTHRSYLNEHKDAVENNERLEFLGDAVLELIISNYLFKQYPDRPEGDLTSFRSALVRTDSLAQTARNLGVGKYLRLSKGEEDTGGREKDYLLANTFEAILGAIYLDQGYDISEKFVYKNLVPKLEEIVANRLDIDSKTKIQEVSQSVYKTTPIYEVIEEKGPDHDKIFTVVVKINGKVIGKGVGGSKQKAEEQAATEGIKYIEKDSN